MKATYEDNNNWTEDLAKMDRHILCLRALGVLLSQNFRADEKHITYVLRGAGAILLDRTDSLMQNIDCLRGEPASD